MRLVLVFTLFAGALTVLAGGGGAAAAARHEQTASAPAPSLVAEPLAESPEALAPSRTPPRTIDSPSTFGMGVLMLAALGVAYQRRRRFIARHAAL